MADADEDTPVASDQNNVELDEETQDYRLLSSLSLNGADYPTLPRRGEKDFEPNPTRHQRSALDASRDAMHDALAHPRLHNPKNHVIGYYEPDSSSDSYISVANARGAFFRTMGTADSQNTSWLLPEEALWLLERGSLDIRWKPDALRADKDDEGVPMSLEAAYATLLGKSGLNLERYHVYAGLRRLGYTVRRAPTWNDAAVVDPALQLVSRRSTSPNESLLAIFRRVFTSLFSHSRMGSAATGPLVAPGLYRNYNDIYRALSLIRSHRPEDSFAEPPKAPPPPFRVVFHVWKPATPFKKSAPPSPDFRIAVVDARSTHVPSLEQISTLLDSLPEDPPASDKRMEVKLKYGYRNVILAVVDTGVVSYMRFSDAAFGEEKLYQHRSKRSGKGGQRKARAKAVGK